MNKLIVDAFDLLLPTEKGIEEVVDSLLKDADIQGVEAEKLRHEAIETLRQVRTQVVDRTSSVVDRVASVVLQRVNLPSRDEIGRLTASVEALREEVVRLRERVDGLPQERPRSRKKPPGGR